MDKQFLLSELWIEQNRRELFILVKKIQYSDIERQILMCLKDTMEWLQVTKIWFPWFYNRWHGFPSFLDSTWQLFFLHFYFKVEATESSNYLRAVGFFKTTSNTKDTLPEKSHSLGKNHFLQGLFPFEWMMAWRISQNHCFD